MNNDINSEDRDVSELFPKQFAKLFKNIFPDYC